MFNPRHAFAVLFLVAAVPLASCTGANPDSCISTPSMCKAGTSCDMKTGECAAGRDGGAGDAGDAPDGGDGIGTDGASDADRPGDGAQDGDTPGGTGALNGEPCASNGTCASGHCSDGVCCNTTCTGPCLSCALGASKGTCSAVKGADDPDSCPTAMMKTCDAKGACASKNGQACTTPAACVSGNCADGVCCDTACTGGCMSCALGASKGTCSAVKNADDPDSCPAAMMKTCDAKGACSSKNGQPCAKPGDCVSGNCVDGVCCNSVCTDKCASCALSGSVGTCSPVKSAEDPDSCPASTSTCDVSGACKLKNGATCGVGTACASGNCADGVCCDTGCTGSCLACALTGSVGTCSPVKSAEDLDTCSGSYICNAAAACRLRDTQACGSNEACASNICGKFFRDADGDGYGDGTMMATFCTSPPSASPPWVTRGDDCCDKDAKVNPGQIEYQLYESTACGSTFDYDCNGTEDKQYPYTYSCATAGDGTCDPTSHDGWSGVIPACGKNGNLSHCGPSLCGPIACCVVTSTDMAVPQRCR